MNKGVTVRTVVRVSRSGVAAPGLADALVI